MTRTEVVTEPSRLYEMLFSDDLLIDNVNFFNDELAEVKFSTQEEFVAPNPRTNVIIAAFTTAHARLKLYSVLEQLQQRVLYYDTDSVIFVSSPGQYNPPVGDYLGDLTSEINPKDGNHITSFVSGGPKNYAYNLDTGKTFCKVRGFTLNCRNSQKINFDTISHMVKHPDTPHVTLTNPHHKGRISRGITYSSPECPRRSFV
ncbi:uncharacterized protein [Asterias amurensis]|uniref:uncharacterized protein n=1 Tax=Asterias amurensis TaxID=7602 RepID=UPI003AB71909